jgi:hypothetical protein
MTERSAVGPDWYGALNGDPKVLGQMSHSFDEIEQQMDYMNTSTAVVALPARRTQSAPCLALDMLSHSVEIRFSEPPAAVFILDMKTALFPGIVGMDRCKNLLIENVGKPLTMPALYSPLRTNFHFAMIGCSGSGKRTIVERMCETLGITYIRIFNVSYFPGLLHQVFQLAQTRKPVLIYFDELDEAIDNTITDTPFLQEFRKCIYGPQESATWDNIWLAFGFMCGVPIAAADIVKNRTADTGYFDKNERGIFLRQWLCTTYQKPNVLSLTANQWSMLLDAMEECVPKDIVNFMQRVFLNRLYREDMVELYKANEKRRPVVPEWENDILPFLERVAPAADGLSSLRIKTDFINMQMETE